MASGGNQEKQEPMGGSSLFAGPVGKKPSARGDGLDLEKELEEEPWCLSPDELDTWYHDVMKIMQRGTELFANACSSEIESVLTKIRESTRHSDTLGFTDTVVKGGSFGKGTMVSGLSDVDLVLVDNKSLQLITETGNLGKYKRALKDITSHLELNVESFRGVEVYPYGVNFQRKVRDRLLEVNLLPTTEQNVQHFLNTDRNTFESMLDVGQETREFYYASFVQQQVRFVKNQPDDVKKLIRLVKYWASRFLPKYLQKSYPLELITIDRWEKAGKPKLLDKAKGLRSVLRVLTNLDELCVYWNFMQDVDDQLNKDIIERLELKRPIILDPANPTNNVGGLYQKGNNQEAIEAAAKRTLRRTALLRNVRAWPITERPQ